jgi:hypothetical protein
MLAAPESRRQSAGRRPWMACAAPTKRMHHGRGVEDRRTGPLPPCQMIALVRLS